MTDARIRGAIRNVSSTDFASGHMGRSMPVSESMMRSASMMRGALPVAHTQASLGSRARKLLGRSIGDRRITSTSSPGAGSTGTGRVGGNNEGFGARSNSMAPGRTEAGATGAGGQSYNWQRYAEAPQAGRQRGAGSNSGFQGRSAPAPQGISKLAAVREPQPLQRRVGQGWTGEPARGYREAVRGGRCASLGRFLLWWRFAPTARLNRPIMRQRAPGGYYGGGPATPRLRVEAAVIPPPAVVVAIAIRRRRAVVVAAVAATARRWRRPQFRWRPRPTDVKLTYQQGQAAGTSTQPAAAPAFLLWASLEHSNA